MKLIWYVYLQSLITAEKVVPRRRSPTSQARYEVALGLSLLAGGIVLKTLALFNVWDFMVENWPYEYGRPHSRNLIAPVSVVFIACFFAIRIFLRKYLRCPKQSLSYLKKIKEKNYTGGIFLGDYSSFIFLVYSAISLVIIFTELWLVATIFLCLLMLAEYYARKLFE